MARIFSELMFTPAVRAAQAAGGSAEMGARFLAKDATPADRFGASERAFITARDGFYQATVTETGWPYVQFRGGPPGFLKVLDDKTLAYADFRGNRQYISTGNLAGSDRVSLILMDYPNQRRLKLLGHARLDTDPNLIARLHVQGYKARPERAVVITLEGFDWNCPQHIPQRLTLDELAPHLAPLNAELQRLSAENAELRAFLNPN